MEILTTSGYKNILEVTIGTEVVAFDMFTGELPYLLQLRTLTE